MSSPKVGMTNNDNQVVDLYIPRRCAWTNRLITARDHSSVRINIAEVDNNGLMKSETKSYDFCGFLRGMGQSDMALNALCYDHGLLEYRM